MFRIITVSRNSRRIVSDQKEDLMYKLLEFGKTIIEEGQAATRQNPCIGDRGFFLERSFEY